MTKNEKYEKIYGAMESKMIFIFFFQLAWGMYLNEIKFFEILDEIKIIFYSAWEVQVVCDTIICE